MSAPALKPPLGVRIWQSAVLTIAAFAILTSAILRQEKWGLRDFDQPFYTTIAYDLDRYGVFTNGFFHNVDSTETMPPTGMFFGPVYPLLVLAGMKIDPRFADAVRCSVGVIHHHVKEGTCDNYAVPMLVIHGLLLGIGALMTALAADLIIRRPGVFWLAGALATAALAMEAEIFSFVMTESVTFSLYSLFAFCLLLSWTTWRPWHFALAGGLLGVLCLTRPSFLMLVPACVALIVWSAYRLARCGTLARSRTRLAATAVLAFTLAFGALAGGWATRNLVSVGKFGLTEEYGAAVLIERFAYNDMTLREFLVALPYCTPGIGDLAFDQIHGADSMHRFVYHTEKSFFHTGRAHRNELIAEHGQLDPVIGRIVIDEMRGNGWRHLLVSVPLAWCGMWVGWLMSLLLIPLFVWACVRAVRLSEPLLLLYAAPAVTMLALHAAVANHTTRYNLALIGPFAVGAAGVILSVWSSRFWRSVDHDRRGLFHGR